MTGVQTCALPIYALDKEVFADKLFTERPLPSVTLGKGFVECISAFAKCLRHSAKKLNLVVVAESPALASLLTITRSAEPVCV